jgi:hypothetical protein
MLIEGLVSLVAMVVFASTVAGIILVPIYLKERTKRSVHSLIAQAMDKGQNLDPELMEKLTESIEVHQTRQQNRPRKTLGNGIVLLALSIGFGMAGYFNGDLDADGMGGLMTTAVILGALGLAFTLLAIVDYAGKKKSEA